MPVTEVVVPAHKIQRVLHICPYRPPAAVSGDQVLAPGRVQCLGIAQSRGGPSPGYPPPKPGAGRPGVAAERGFVINKGQLRGDGRAPFFLRGPGVVVPHRMLPEDLTEVFRIGRWFRGQQAETKGGPDAECQAQNGQPVPAQAGAPDIKSLVTDFSVISGFSAPYPYQTVISEGLGALAGKPLGVS